MNPESISPPRPGLSEMAGPSREAARNSLLNRAWPALAAAFVAIRALPLLSVLLGQDQAIYLLFGEALLKGKQPYRDILESKPPGILILYAGIAKLFGRSMWSAAVVDILLLLVISYLLFHFVEPYLGRAGAAIAVMVHASMYGEMTYFWIAQAETALDMMVDRSLHRYSHGSLLAEKQGVQWLIADSAMELYQCKLMVLHAAYKIDRGDDFRTEVSMAKHFVANSLNRIIDRSMQVHGALGYSTDTPLANMLQHARWARFADGADEIHQMRIAERTIAAYKDTGSTNAATGGLPL